MTESGFISNAYDEEVLSSANGRTQIAYSHLAGAHDYYGLPAPTLYGNGGGTGIAGLGAIVLAIGALGWTWKIVKEGQESKKGGKGNVL